MPRKRSTKRKRVAVSRSRPPRRPVRGQSADEERRRAEASSSLVNLRMPPGQSTEKLRREVTVLLDELRTYVKTMEIEKRPLTPTEASDWDRIEAEVVARKASISMHEEIDRLAFALRDPLHMVDSTRWRCSQDAVRRKLAEELLHVFIHEIQRARRWYDGIRSLQAERDAYLKAAKILQRVPRISTESEAAFRFHGGMPVPTNPSRHADGLNERVNWFLRFRQRPLSTHIARELDRLIPRLAAILAHTTDLSLHYILGELLPWILDTAWQFYPSLAPRRGAADPLTRYKRNIRNRVQDARLPVEQRRYLDPHAMLTLSSDCFSKYRELLFRNDDRFPLSLFQTRRSSRTVVHKAPTRLR